MFMERFKNDWARIRLCWPRPMGPLKVVTASNHVRIWPLAERPLAAGFDLIRTFGRPVRSERDEAQPFKVV